MSHFHAVAWIDHHEAHVLHFTPDEAERTVVHAHGRERQVHHRKGTAGAGKAPEDRDYFKRVAASLADAQEVLVCGPALAKQEFLKYLEKHAAGLAKRIVGVENADHPTDGQLLAHARRWFVAADRMRTQPGTRQG